MGSTAQATPSAPSDPPKPFRAGAVFGTNQTRIFADIEGITDEKEMREYVEGIFPMMDHECNLAVREYATQAELDAYWEGVEDGDGWLEVRSDDDVDEAQVTVDLFEAVYQKVYKERNAGDQRNEGRPGDDAGLSDQED